MKLEILKVKKFENGKKWFLAELNLFQYVTLLTEENFKFDVQRKIVKNRYLDKILKTIYSKEPLPPITLAYSDKNEDVIIKSTLVLEESNIDILDGLQRSYRLWALWQINDFVSKNDFESLRSLIKHVKGEFPEFFENGIVDSKFFKKHFSELNAIPNFTETYSEYDMYFYVWMNLSEKELVRKMLILNAGHKAVSTQHQFEILFLSLWKALKNSLPEINIVREKDQSFSQIKRGNRKAGDYLFSSIITSMMSLIIGKPQRISGDIIYKYDLLNHDNNNSKLAYIELLFNSEFIKSLLAILYQIDKSIQDNQNDLALSWFGKDTTLNGIFAGVGKYIGTDENKELIDLDGQIIQAFNLLKTKISSNLNIEGFNREYNNVSGRSVNIGNLIRTIIMRYTIISLENGKPDWKSIFNREMNR